MTDRKKPQAIADDDLEGAQGGLYSTSAAGTELMTDASTMETRRKLRRASGDGFIGVGAETEI